MIERKRGNLNKRLRNAQKISSRFQKISEGKVIDNEVFRANFLN